MGQSSAFLQQGAALSLEWGNLTVFWLCLRFRKVPKEEICKPREDKCSE